VTGLLDALAEDDSVALAVLTGNTEAGARVKLRHFRIDHHFPVGAYGDDHHDRNELGPIALERARHRFGKDFRPDGIVVIGDTLRDIACARAFGAKVIAVATGAATRAELAAASPDVLLDDFSDRDRVLAAFASVFSSSAPA
jgi:phosphoglycolate phosphatase-like HAD superfamily hydrolase